MGNRKDPSSGERGKQKDKKRAQSAKRERRHPIWRILGYTCLGIVGCGIVGAGAAAGYVASMLKGLPTVTADTFQNLSEPTIVYDRNGKVIGKFAADGDRQPITNTSEVSPYLTKAFVAAEDKTFYQNIGINPVAIARAAVQDVVFHRIVSGASTITQQTVKLAMFPEQQQTAKRKIQEIALALKVNKLLTKDEILTDYMNWVYMGKMGTNNVYGVKAASQILFKKDVKDLSLAEASFLAAIPNNAYLFSPYDHPDNTVKRQHYILQQMLDNGMITQQQYDQAMTVDIQKEINKKPTQTSTKYPYIMYDNVEPLVVNYLVESGNYSSKEDAEKALPTAGFKVYTTIDLSKQDDIDKVLKDDKLYKGSTTKALDKHGKVIKDKSGKVIMDKYEAGATLIDNQTGGILAIGGGRDFNAAYTDHSQVPRQPGSSIKPILDYGPAIDMHQLTAASPLLDAPVKYSLSNGKTWTPHDAEAGWAGIMTARQALVESRNVPAIRLLDMIHPQVGMQYVQKLGITTKSTTLSGKPTLDPQDLTSLGSAIGGLTNGVTVQQMTSAYTVFPNQGIYRPSYMVSKITDRDGNPVYQHKAESHSVFSAQTAYVMTDILHGVLYGRGGTAGIIGSHFPGYYISGKTGTTDDQRDGWFIGYSQKYTLGVWMGYDYHEVIPGNWYNLKFTVWNKMMDPILKKEPPTKPFPKPSGLTTVQVCSKSGQLPTDLCKEDKDVYSELFIQGTEPTDTCNVHVSAWYTVVNGKKYLATTNTPPNELKQGVFLQTPKGWDGKTVTADSAEYLPTKPDPRGGTLLQQPSTGAANTLSPPTGLTATVGGNGASVQLSWSPVQGATKYTVWRADSLNGPYKSVATVDTTSYTDTAVQGKAQLYYEVAALADNAIPSPSAPVPVTLANSPPPGGTGGTGPGNSTDTSAPEFLWPRIDDERSH